MKQQQPDRPTEQLANYNTHHRSLCTQ